MSYQTNKRKRTEDLPRGGDDTPLVRPVKKSKKSKKRKNKKWSSIKRSGRHQEMGVYKQSDESSEGSVDGIDAIISTKAPKKAPLLTYKRISEGMLFLGSVEEINEYDLVISLPDNISGTVSIAEISDTLTDILIAESEGVEVDVPELSDIFTVGEFIKVSVLAVKRSRGSLVVELTMRESILNYGLDIASIPEKMPIHGSIKSVEDHGYIVSLGFEDFSGFLPRDKIEKEVQVGYPIDAIVTDIKKKQKIAFIDASTKRVVDTTIKSDEMYMFNMLRPGFLIKATVSKYLPNGLWLKFMGYFVGAVNIFHIPGVYNSEEIYDKYQKGDKVYARILYIDVVNKKIVLSLLSQIRTLEPVEIAVEVGDIIESAVIKRIDSSIGIAVEIPTEPPISGYVHISKYSDKRLKSVPKNVNVGDTVKARIMSIGYCDNIVQLSMRRIHINQPLFRYEDVELGSIITGSIKKVSDKAILVKLTPTITGFVPRSHMSDFGVKDPVSRFSVGSRITCRVLQIDPSDKKLVLTHKKTIVQSELPIITSYDVPRFTISHGTILHVSPTGCIVGFFNDVKGRVHISDLSARHIKDPQKSFKPGQVIRCRVLQSNLSTGKLKISFVIPVEKTDEMIEEIKSNLNNITLGQFVTGKITMIQSVGVNVIINSTIEGYIPLQNLSDHRKFCIPIRKKLNVGDTLEDLLVLNKNEETGSLLLTMKYSMKEAAANNKIPSTFEEVEEGKIYNGIVKNVTAFGVYVGFLGDVVGLAFRALLTDFYCDDNLNKYFYPGQSVRAYVVETKEDSQQISLNLKPSLCCSKISPSFMESYFEDHKLCERKREGINWKQYSAGKVVEGTILQIAEIGVILSLDDGNLTGFAHKEQIKGADLTATTIECFVLDVNKRKGILDVSLRPELINGENQEPSELNVGDSVSAVIELIQTDYVILSIDSKYGNGSIRKLVYAPTSSYNDKLYSRPFDVFRIGAKKKLLVTSIDSKILGTIDTRPKRKRNVSMKNSLKDVQIGMEVSGVVRDIFKTTMIVTFGHLKANIHITEVRDDHTIPTHPFSDFHQGMEIPKMRIIEIGQRRSRKFLPLSQSKPKKVSVIRASIRPSVLNGPQGHVVNSTPTWKSLSKGQIAHGWIHEVLNDGLWIHVSADIRGRVFILDVSNDVQVLSNLKDHYAPGQGVTFKVMRIDAKREVVDLSIKAVEEDENVPYTPNEIEEGMIITGRISRVVLKSGINIQLFSHVYGRAFLTDIYDDFKLDPCIPYVNKVGEFVKCYVLGVDKKSNRVDLSLRPTRVYNRKNKNNPEIKNASQLTPGTIVKGYISSIDEKTAFVALSRNISGRVFVSNLSDKFIKNPAKAFPVGKLVVGMVTKWSKKGLIDLTLKKSLVQEKSIPFSALTPGMKIKGWVKRITDFGVFITIQNCGVIGLCHISEVSDEHTDDLNNIFAVGDFVKAQIIRTNPKKKQVSLSLKPSHFIDDSSDESSQESISDNNSLDLEVSSSEESSSEEESLGEDIDHVLKETSTPSRKRKKNEIQKPGKKKIIKDEYPSDEEQSAFSDEEVENTAAHATMLWENFRFQNEESSSSESDAMDLEENLDSEEEDESKSKKRKSKRKTEQKQREDLEEKEDEMLDDSRPVEQEDFEKLLFENHNSSYAWIQYMAHWIKLAEIEKARAVAERALKKIDASEQTEKFNVWVAYMNMENSFGSKDSLNDVFNRALSYNEKKPIYQSAIQMYQKSNNIEKAEELHKVLIKKFKSHKSVWIRYIIFLFRQNKPEEARNLLPRALKSLPRRKHIQTISKVAQLEFKIGQVERGRTMFEDLIGSYAKRADLWNIYIDHETRLGDIERIRRLYMRVITMKFSKKKMKNFFKRFLRFETNYGDESTIAFVKQKAEEFIEARYG
eukprot:TRINITY_DN9400_c0_g1_i1.p1 TRINITY_DN9400_c0_g1~~TRINITY_DN9400_c0_g1_i1.p1  ORF type:complete len:1891 (-),score=497.58 TRINITY_DN9400_c0_g1_i1:96-5768(-)